MKLTSSYLLKQYLDQATDKEKEMVEKMFYHYTNHYKTLLSQTDGYTALFNMLTLLDYVIEEEYKDNVFSCKTGCSYCCEQNVDITQDEAELIFRWCKKNNIPLKIKRLRQQVHYNKENWHSQYRTYRTCVFLSSKNKCKIYDIRPIACRKHFTNGDPNNCNVVTPKQIPLAFNPHIETIHSAIISISPVDSMPKQLLKLATKE